ncbi:anti-sigma factor [Hahella sp. CR1]|uniref:anti-sigma factor n=1 Tax=Hahella sp. CR1 TaxID=2992807 RepID=UPI002441B663|nr:anti-sigma factor [Hahella sp. CR1]MDG9669322.1 anti-sigma factor [Hahella sp. CR1]
MPRPLRYKNPELLDRLASNYVIGALRGKARKRFEAIMRQDETVAKRVRQWEEKFQPLHEKTAPLAPKTATWKAISASINDAPSQLMEKLLRKLSFYKYLSAAALSLALCIALYPALSGSEQISPEQASPAPSVNYVAVMENTDEQAVMVVTVDKAARQLSLNIVEKPVIAQNATLQLWAVSRDDNTVRSLGAIELKGQTQRNLSQREWELIQSAEHLLVSIEKPGGSATGAPSAQLLAKGLCVKVAGWRS